MSVIVDKRNILYGQTAVDLTDKLLERLEENGL
jgi:Skp family chaperone for outer membrane proteins